MIIWGFRNVMCCFSNFQVCLCVCVVCVCVFISETKMNAAVSFHKEAQFIFKKTALQLK